MFRFRFVQSCLRRLLHGGTVTRDPVLQQLRMCVAEEQVFDVVGKNTAKLTVDHVGRAVGMLWQFQKEKPQMLRTVELINSHPQFLTLRVLAENKITHMDNLMLVDILYSFLRLNVEPHDSLVQQLVSEAWLRIDRLPMTSLSKFAICLSDQHLQHSTLMGHITSIIDQMLPSIHDVRILSTLMISVSSLVSVRLRDALIDRAGHLLDTIDVSNYNSPRRLFNNCDFMLAARQRLTELVDSSTDPFSFTKLFVGLGPMASQETKERLENTALLLADELNAQQALAIAETLEEIQSRNLSLLNKIASVIKRNLHVYKPVEVARITQALFLLQYQNPELFAKLRNTLITFLRSSIFPYEVSMLTRVLSLLPSPRLDETLLSRMEAVAPQCTLSDLNSFSFVISKWVRNDSSFAHNTPSKYVHLLQVLNRCGCERLHTADRLDLLLEELKYISGEWFEEMLVSEVMATLQRMMDQINWTNVVELAYFLTKINQHCPPLLDQIASVAIKDIEKIHPSATYAMLLPFSVLNYDPAQADELYDVCIQHIIPHISSFDPHLLVFLAYSLALADYFPEELVRTIFSIDFLGKLDAQLETLPDALNMRTRLRLMELNRAVCLECPEFQVPWFHERYCQYFTKKGSGSPAQQQIHKLLSDVLGGYNCVRVEGTTPYSYTIDFECILDAHMQPLPFSEPATLQISNRGKVHWATNSMERVKEDLPPGAQRYV
ncbi:hypothetical protein fugu_000067 [Takifugu bimaculatus]|uniref:FAST kinase leucine-rich domain-containing protein n=1 Tax=Takifugu bimaculatus TaxID=433685 RepID=A0A4Z2CFN0_9TELE|nr:hypothetical protein fugu_000067 [Takifugu bimaculatus]